MEEELLIVLDGEAEILVATSADPESAEVKRFVPGSFIYYPAYQYHTLRNTSSAPVTYLMFKWQGAPLEVLSPLATTVAEIGGISAAAHAAPMSARFLFEAPTAYLGKLHAHVTELQPGGAIHRMPTRTTWRLLCFPGASRPWAKPWGHAARSIMRLGNCTVCAT